MISNNTLRDRLLQVADALAIETGGTPRTLDAAASVLATGVGEPSHRASYLLLAVATGTIPYPEQVVELERRWSIDGATRTIASVIERARRANRFRAPAPVRIERGVIVDVNDTAHTPSTTGIQRVVRSTLVHWLGSKPATLVAWTGSASSPRTLRRRELALVTGENGPRTNVEIVVPLDAVWVLPEIATHRNRVDRMLSIALYSGSRTTAIGHDCIPMTSAETAGVGMPAGFARYLTAVSRFTNVATTSSSSFTEFAGFNRMLSGAGLPGPEVHTVALPTSSEPGPANDGLVREAGIADGATLVLAVGSHEPRKNHLALLQAAELAWRDGLEFTLVLVGGNSWARIAFDQALDEARARGRSIITLAGASDALVWALYRRARFTVFPSLNEGFGLPVVESISAGTPVITSDFGSMRESAEGFGGVLINPRDDHDLAAAIRRLLTDDKLLAKLQVETGTAPQRSWAQYAEELWALSAADE